MVATEWESPGPQFVDCWNWAAEHLDRYGAGTALTWLRAHPYPPFLEHLSFCVGNQAFFVRIEDVDERLQMPGSRQGLIAVAERARGHACLMQMQRALDSWLPVDPGWGLVSAHDTRPIDPPELVSDEAIDLSEIELHELSVEVVRQHLMHLGHELIWQGGFGIDPSLWFFGPRGVEWVIVRSRSPAKGRSAGRLQPSELREVAAECAALSRFGHVAEVLIACPETLGTTRRLLRGRPLSLQFHGLRPLSSKSLRTVDRQRGPG